MLQAGKANVKDPVVVDEVDNVEELTVLKMTSNRLMERFLPKEIRGLASPNKRLLL